MFSETRVPQPHEAQKYQDALLKALMMVHLYDGTEESYESVTHALAEFEDTVTAFNVAPGASIEGQELKAFEMFLRRDQGGRSPTISTLLDVAAASESAHKAIRQSLISAESKERLPLLIRHIQGVILPPDSPKRVPMQGEGMFEAERFEERLFELQKLLERGHVFLDDCICTIGDVLPSQMREVSYACVEIPRIDRTVLVCDQVGEATFVIRGIGDPHRYLSLTKDELLENFSASVRRIVKHNRQQWEADLGKFLFTEEAWQETLSQIPTSRRKRPKLDVKQIAELRDTILQSGYNNPEAWVKLPFHLKKIRDLKLFGAVGMEMAARILGVEERGKNKLTFLEIGRKVFGDHPVLLQAIEEEKLDKTAREGLTPEIIKAAVEKSEYNSPELWVAMPESRAVKFKILRSIGLNAIAKALGAEGDPMYRSARLEVGRKIFGDHPVLMDAINEEKKKKEILETLTPEKIISAILATEYNTPESWVKMTSRQVRDLKIFETVGIVAIASALGIKGDWMNSILSRLEVARKIFGDDPVLMQAIALEREKKEALEQVTLENITDEVLKSAYNTPEAWSAMTQPKAAQFKLLGSTLTRIARHFNIEGDPVGTKLVRLEMGRKIFGDHPVLMRAIEAEKLDPENVITAIKMSKYNTPEAWITMSSAQAQDFKIFGTIGLLAIATSMGVRGDVTKKIGRLELAQKIYGDIPLLSEAVDKEKRVEEIQKTLTPEKVVAAIKESKYGTPETWVNMSSGEARDFKILEVVGLQAVASSLHLENKKISKTLDRLEIGRKVFGDQPVIMQAIDREKLDPEKVIVEIKKSKFGTPEAWTTMPDKEIRKFKILGTVGLNAIARALNIVGSPIDKKNVRLEIGRKVFGDEAIDTAPEKL